MTGTIRTVVAWGKGMDGLTRKGQEGTFWGDGAVLSRWECELHRCMPLSKSTEWYIEAVCISLYA